MSEDSFNVNVDQYSLVPDEKRLNQTHLYCLFIMYVQVSERRKKDQLYN